MSIKEVAKRAGVSIATVSRTINTPEKVHPHTVERVQRVIEKLGYRPNLTARALKTGRTNLVGLVVPDLVHSFFAELARGLSGVLREEDISVVIASSEEDPSLEQGAIDHLLDRGVDALLVASVQLNKDSFQKITKQKVPFILVDRVISGLAANFVGVKDETVGYIATEHLIQIGCRNVAHISGTRISTAVGRLAGYQRAIKEYGLSSGPDHIVTVEKQDESADVAGYRAAMKLLSLPERPDGIFCFNDPIAIGAMNAILAKGLRIPEDIALIGSGNLHFDGALRVPLSTVDQCSEMIGQRAALLAMNLIEEKSSTSPKTVFLAPKVVVRESTKRPNVDSISRISAQR
ncbi:MAG TPA: LacI family DNA-binding transcriptional regulator [Terriglobales bacterium]